MLTNRLRSLFRIEGSVVAACDSVCDPGEGVLVDKVEVCLPLRIKAAVAWLSGNVYSIQRSVRECGPVECVSMR